MADKDFKYKKKKSSKGKVIAILLAILAVGIAVAWMVTDRYYIESKKHLAPEDYYKLENMAPNKGIIVINGEVADTKCHMVNGVGYLPIEYVDRDINSRFYSDKETDGILYTTGKGTISFTAGSNTYTDEDGQIVNEATPPVIKEADRYYISADFVSKFSDITAASFTNPDRVVINADKEWNAAHVTEDAPVRYYAGIKSDIITDVTKGDLVKVLEQEGDKWTKVYTADGYTGYIKSDKLSGTEKQSTESADADTFTHITIDTPFTLSWFHVTNKDANANYDEHTKSVKGLDVICPTWYSFADNKGTINDFSDASLVEKMHAAGYKVWPVVNDLTNKVDMKELLSSKSMRERMIERLVSDATAFKYDGINVDFETITNESSIDFLQFLRELTIACHKNNLVVSVDNYPPKRYNFFYDVTEQAQYADYIVLMNYDEHYAGSEEIGSVSSMEFFRQNIADALEHVPAERLVNAMPFYTRLWGQNKSGKIVSSEALDMKTAQETISKNSAKLTWDEAAGQNVATYEKTNINYSMWVEDANSIKLRLDESKKNALGGVGFWRLGYETEDVWKFIAEYKN